MPLNTIGLVTMIGYFEPNGLFKAVYVEKTDQLEQKLLFEEIKNIFGGKK